MSLVKTSLLSAIAVVARVLSALVLNKILAVYVGPAGFAIIGQFQNSVSVIVKIAGGVFVSGVTKATAQYYDDEQRQHAVWQTAIRIALGTSLMLGVTLLFMRDYLAQWLLHRADMSNVFVWLALSLPAMALNNILLSIVNGKKEVGVYVSANIAGSMISMLLTGLLTYKFGLYGALVAFTINPAAVFLTTASMIACRDWFKAQFLWGTVNRTVLRELSGYGLMGLTTAISLPITYMLIRDHLSSQLNLDAAGFWQASWKISEIYLMLITSTLSVYYLPRVAEIKTASELKTEIIKVYRFVLPLVIVCALTIYLLRDFIIQVLFSADFSPMRELFAMQLTGDVIKIASWVLGYILVGRGLVKLFIVSEIAYCVSFYLLTWIFVDIYGLTGVAIAYAVNYVIYFIVMAVIARLEMRKMEGVYGK